MTAEHLGELSLCLLMAAKQRSLNLLTETLREIGQSLTEKEGMRAYRQIQLDLNPKDRDWLKGQMLKLYEHCDSRSMPYTAYLWRPTEADLTAVVTLRLSQDERDRLDQQAKAKGMSRCEYARKMFREILAQGR